MELTDHACTEALSEAEEAERREKAGDNAGGVRVELRVRRLACPSLALHELGEAFTEVVGISVERYIEFSQGVVFSIS